MVMRCLFGYLRALGFCLAIGPMIFFAAIFAPKVFKVLERPDAALLQGEVFPGYFLLVLVGTVLAALAHIFYLRMTTKPTRSDLVGLGIMGIVVALLWISLTYFTPEIKALYPALYTPSNPPSLEQLQRFQFLHKASVGVNIAALLGLMISLGLLKTKSSAL